MELNNSDPQLEPLPSNVFVLTPAAMAVLERVNFISKTLRPDLAAEFTLASTLEAAIFLYGLLHVFSQEQYVHAMTVALSASLPDHKDSDAAIKFIRTVLNLK